MFYIKKWFTILFISSLAISCENDIHEVENLGKKKLGVEEGTGIVSQFSQAGRIKAVLKAPYMLRYQYDTVKIEFPRTLHVDFYDSTAKIDSRLFARFGSYLENENKVLLRDSVIVFNIKGDTLFTNELFWDQLKGTYYTDKPVIISQTNPIRQKLYGTGFSSNQDLTNIKVYKVGYGNAGQSSFLNVPDSSL
ncbi:MAG: LPS export ABC transporter periplasmic protein LptC [Hydrotalea flava]|uniref:LPS export ABC transporter periplasmic protein LptC n=1 Tax=Hydrotalea flava TaxID=714549 RepID=UPI000835F53F|nr:LPS export ABC transporter periplasmic protein LptC [Hydrotalea flava]RTL56939.1 MAG: LPS export ABC transporter periplasmic protein LptC [Sphingobacteriales bacterium]NIM35615.1 LPS export ABC transporter periplasmic protein LptC [Hydrotalea flava]NIM38474.1 LPS export ABC transporter periplasmic protein LptC [Hydrotalea flava]NIN03997.1 LPS export ABC transporter periplasmic protein LptC [Hydrotalea flava]NIN15331.1 LPS export ABC transporter periplasmic protein LptC [Hydrotalea flava]